MFRFVSRCSTFTHSITRQNRKMLISVYSKKKVMTDTTRRTSYILLCITSLIAISCTQTKDISSPAKGGSLKYLDTITVNFGTSFQHTIVGGLSGIDYDKKNDKFFLISDDRSAINPARFYTARMHLNDKRIDSINFLSVHFLSDSSGDTYPNAQTDPFHTLDPESIRYWNNENKLVWSSEGERVIKNGKYILADPAINITDTIGRWIGGFPIPQHLKMSSTETGPRVNGVFEGLSFTPNDHSLFVSVEEPLYQDGPRADVVNNGAVARILKYNTATMELESEFAYPLEPVERKPVPENGFKVNGISEILALDDHHLIIMERSYSTGYLGCTIKIFIADLTQATNVKDFYSLREASYQPISKRLLINLDDLGFYIDNVEGICFGPMLSNHRQSVILVSDNNFNPFEKMQFFLFEWIP